MPNEDINGVSIFLEEFGSGDPLVLVHGSWTDHMEWPFIVPGLAQRLRVTVYDRRGHSQSERLPRQGTVHEDVADLAAIIGRAGAPAHVLGNSMGASISLRLAAEHPELMRTLVVHEPPLFNILLDDPKTKSIAEETNSRMLPVINDLAAGNMEDGARSFIDMVLGPDAWDDFIPDEAKRTLLNNAPTFLDETRDPETLSIDMKALARFERPVLLTGGSQSPPFFAPVLDKLAAVLPKGTRKTLPRDGHLPHITHPQEYVALIIEFIDTASS